MDRITLAEAVEALSDEAIQKYHDGFPGFALREVREYTDHAYSLRKCKAAIKATLET